MTNGQQSKFWCFTLNNYTRAEEDGIQALVSGEEAKASFVVYGRERGENGTPHLQGYVEFPKRLRLAQVKRLLGERVHLERRRGSAQEAATYCRKDGDVYEAGTISRPQPGKRTDLDRAVESIRDGASVRELWQEHSVAMVRYSAGLLQLRQALNPSVVAAAYSLESFRLRLPQPRGLSLLVVGGPGIGKTQLALATFPKALFVTHMDQLKEFVAEEHEAIIFDDMSFSHLPRTAQIHLVDQEQPRAIHVRYGVAVIPAFTPKVFLSNIEGIFDMSDGAIRRRIHLVRFPFEMKLFRENVVPFPSREAA